MAYVSFDILLLTRNVALHCATGGWSAQLFGQFGSLKLLLSSSVRHYIRSERPAYQGAAVAVPKVRILGGDRCDPEGLRDGYLCFPPRMMRCQTAGRGVENNIPCDGALLLLSWIMGCSPHGFPNCVTFEYSHCWFRCFSLFWHDSLT